MANRERDKLLRVYVSEKEYELVQKKMQKLNIERFSQYARKMLIDGFVINIKDIEKIIEFKFEINKIGVNINQIAKRANETRDIDKEMINEVVKKQEELENLINKKFKELFKYGYN